jgi:cytochrome c peroxidase
MAPPETGGLQKSNAREITRRARAWTLRAMTTTRTILLLAAMLVAAPANADEALRSEALQRFGIVEHAPSPRAPATELGRALFWDARVSADGKTSCASCHSSADWGGDSRRVPVDARGKAMPRNSPTVFNALGQPALRWLADRQSGAQLAEGLITGPLGFAAKPDAVKRLHELGYEKHFRAAFPDDAEPVSAPNYARALEAYQATLATPAPFDRFLAGDSSALTPREQAGLRKFIAAGCAGCHAGPLLGGTSVQKFGLARDYWTVTGSKTIDPGLYAVTKKEADRYRFRVPMLRNVAKTAPYFHDGSVETLERAVQVMAATQLGRDMDEATAADIAAFLGSLTGTPPAHFAPPAR